MAITDEKITVLILGAGTSAPFGLPLGGSMISDLSKAIGRELGHLDRREESGETHSRAKLMYAAKQREEFSKIPVLGTVARGHLVEDENEFNVVSFNEELEKIRHLEKLLDNQTSETIDDFIVENPSYAHLTKIGIAALFMKSCYDFRNNGQKIKPFSARYHPPRPNKTDKNKMDDPERNWVHLLINIVRQGIRLKTVSEENKVTIITFNYDKILEHVLEEQFSNTEANYPHYSAFIDIIHVHGECGELKDAIRRNPAKVCLDWANGIFVVNESNVPIKVKENRDRAKAAIASAQELYFCGFAFAQTNCKLLGLDSSDSLDPQLGARLVSFCNYEGNIGISRNARKYEKLNGEDLMYDGDQAIRIVEEDQGSSDKPLSVTNWLYSGRLGELP